MKPPPFDYAAPDTLEEAVDLLARHGDEAKLMAGGQSLVPLLAFRLASPSMIVDLNRVSELEYLRVNGDRVAIGAMTRHRDVEDSRELRGRCAMLSEAVSSIGHVAIRNRGTVGGSLAHADPAAEWPALALALDAELDAVGPAGRRTIPADEFFVTYFTPALQPDEVLAEVRLSIPRGRVGSAFVELARRHGDFAIAGVGALLGMDEGGTVRDARVVLIGVRDRAVRSRRAEDALLGGVPTDERIAAAAEAVDEDIDPPSDVHGSSGYRRHVARVLVRRALSSARARAEEGGDGGR